VRYLPCQVTNMPVLQIDTAIWRYPDMMRSAGVTGRVRAALIVDTAGRYVPGSLQVLASSNEQFSYAMKYALSRAHFSPGRRGRGAVPVELVHDVVFAMPAHADFWEMRGVAVTVSLASMPSLDSIPALEIRVEGEDAILGPPPAPAIRDSLAHEAIRVRARELGWEDNPVRRASKSPPLLLCVRGDTGVFESAADRALAASMTRLHVRVITMRGCPPTRQSMVPDFPGIRRRQYPDSATFVEPHRLYVTRVALRRGGGPQIELVDEQGLSEGWIRCVRIPRAPSIFDLRCWQYSWGGH
jgi:hypothetical protein